MTRNENQKEKIERALAEEKRTHQRQTLLRRLWRIAQAIEAEENAPSPHSQLNRPAHVATS